MSFSRVEAELLEFFSTTFKFEVEDSTVTMCGRRELIISCKKGTFLVRRSSDFTQPPTITKKTKSGLVMCNMNESWLPTMTTKEWVKKLISSV